MAENSKIEWTHHTWSPWEGCTKVSAGCANCYAANEADGRWGRVVWGPKGTRRVRAEAGWKDPIRWNKIAKETGVRLRVFPSMCDPFEDWRGYMIHSGNIPLWKMDAWNGHPYRWAAGHVIDPGLTGRELSMNDVRRRLFELIQATPYLDWLLLTKRPENVLRFWPRHLDADDDPELWSVELGQLDEAGSVPRHLKNVWIGTSVENQEAADARIPELLKLRDLSPVLWLSMEPMLGPVDLSRWLLSDSPFFKPLIDWVIQGGESQDGARWCHPAWARFTRDQCDAAGIAYLFKQWGEWLPTTVEAGTVRVDVNGSDVTNLPGLFDESDIGFVRVGKKAAGRELDGQIHNQFPMGQVT